MNQPEPLEVALEKLDLNADDLFNLVFDGKIRASAPKTGNKPIKIPQQTKEEAEADRRLYEECNELDEADRKLYEDRPDKPPRDMDCALSFCTFPYDICFDIEDDYKCTKGIPFLHCATSWQAEDFLNSPERIPNPERIHKLVNILEDVETNYCIRRKALEALLPILKYDIEKIISGEAGEEQTTASPMPVENNAVNFFTRENGGNIWRIGFKGETKAIKHVNGLLYICYLLQNPQTSISCRIVYGTTPDNVISEGAAINQGMNIKRYAGSGDKKAQSNAKKRLNKAYEAIRNADMKKLAKHLQDNIRSDGAYGYTYTGAITWEITIK